MPYTDFKTEQEQTDQVDMFYRGNIQIFINNIIDNARDYTVGVYGGKERVIETTRFGAKLRMRCRDGDCIVKYRLPGYLSYEFVIPISDPDNLTKYEHIADKYQFDNNTNRAIIDQAVRELTPFAAIY